MLKEESILLSEPYKKKKPRSLNLGSPNLRLIYCVDLGSLSQQHMQILIN